MSASANGWLFAGGCLSLTAAVLHLACIVGGPAWYRSFGAGERIARAAERGEWWPALITLGIAAVLALWSAYAFSGAGLIPRLPLLKTGLTVITVIYLLRGLVLFFPAALRRPDLSATFVTLSSAIVLGFGLVHAIGLSRGWRTL